MGLSFLLPLLPRLCLRIGGEDLRDDPVQIVKEGRPLPQDAAAMIPDGFEDVHWKPQSRPRSRGGNTYVDRFRQIKRSHFRQLNRFLVYNRRYTYIY